MTVIKSGPAAVLYYGIATVWLALASSKAFLVADGPGEHPLIILVVLAAEAAVGMCMMTGRRQGWKDSAALGSAMLAALLLLGNIIGIRPGASAQVGHPPQCRCIGALETPAEAPRALSGFLLIGSVGWLACIRQQRRK